jgi:hypothetical protein
MSAEQCMCGSEDCARCYPGTSPEPTDLQLEYALDEIVECILCYGKWPRDGRPELNLYEFVTSNIFTEHNFELSVEVYVAALMTSPGVDEFCDLIERERKHVEQMLKNHLIDSDIVYDLATEYAAN